MQWTAFSICVWVGDPLDTGRVSFNILNDYPSITTQVL